MGFENEAIAKTTLGNSIRTEIGVNHIFRQICALFASCVMKGVRKYVYTIDYFSHDCDYCRFYDGDSDCRRQRTITDIWRFNHRVRNNLCISENNSKQEKGVLIDPF